MRGSLLDEWASLGCAFMSGEARPLLMVVGGRGGVKVGVCLVDVN